MKRLPLWLVLLLSLLAGLAAISGDSLWIDEGFSAARALQPTAADWWHSMVKLGGSELQMPLYMAYLWAWVKICGGTEWALRAANIPWFLLSQAAFWLGFRRWPRLRAAIVLCAACHPHLWRYLNEARPYLMQYSGSAIVVACLAALAGEEEPLVTTGWAWAMGGGLLVLCASSALGIAWAAAAMVALVFLLWGRARVAASLAWPIGTSCAFLGALAGYYKWTVAVGGGAATGLGDGLKSFGFALYEIFGLAGLGPGRLAIRESYFHPFIPYLPVLGCAALCLAAVLAWGSIVFARAAPRRAQLAAAAYTLLPPLLLAALAVRTDFRVLGRHLIPMTPAVVLPAALALAGFPKNQRRWPSACAFLLATLWLASSFEIRFAARHMRDDYRDAARAANLALLEGKSVWWAASDVAGKYYHLPIAPLGNTAAADRAAFLFDPTAADLATFPVPDLVAFSKPDFFDGNGALAVYLQAHHYRQVQTFPAFTIWAK